MSSNDSLKNSHLYREIHEQPHILATFLQRQKQVIQQLAAAIKKQRISHVVIAARGTSDNAGRYAKYVLGAKNRLTVALATPSLFSIYREPPCFGNALVLGISQSGQSPDIVSVVAQAKKQGSLTAVITNNPTSNLAQVGDFVIDLHAGNEQAVAATKTYTSELAAIALLSATLATDQEMLHEIEGIETAVSQTLTMQDAISQITPRYRYMSHCVVIGRGYNYATAFEMALKLKELTYTIVEPYSSADFLHGPVAIVENGFPVIILAPSGKMLPELQTFLTPLQQRQAEIITISDGDAVLSQAHIPLKLPYTVPEWLSPFTTIIPGQLFALHLAHTRRYDVDAPRGLQKVTETH
ncbi:MAG: SIS domain-containing protein [Chloroflexota bacterium]